MLTSKNGQLADCRQNQLKGGLERSVVIGDIRFLIGLCSIADINAQLIARIDISDFCAFLCAKGTNITESGEAVC
jgi:hypothetical protein